MPVCPPLYRLVDDQGCIIRAFEKHICEVIELLWTLYPPKHAANGVFLDFCCGTAPAGAGLAALRANFKTILLNDRDVDIQPYAEARLRAYLQHLTKGRANGDTWPGLGFELSNKHNSRWNGLDPYSLLSSFMRVDRDGVAILPMKNTPSRFRWNCTQYLDLHGLKIANSKVIEGIALFLKKTQKKGFVLRGMPVCPPLYRLVDDQGCIIRPFEKHICEVIELLWTLYGPKHAANGVFLDFCCGTAPAGLAALRANSKTILLMTVMPEFNRLQKRACVPTCST